MGRKAHLATLLAICCAPLSGQDAGKILAQAPFYRPRLDIRALAIARDGEMFAVAYDKNYGPDGILIWERKSGRLLQTLAIEGVLDVVFSPDGNTLYSCGSGKEILCWDWRVGKPRQSISRHRENVCCLACSPDGSMLASAGLDNTVRIWRTAKGTRARVLKAGMTCQRIVFSPNGRLVAGADVWSAARVWEVESGKEVLAIPADDSTLLRGMDFAPDSERLYISCGRGAMSEWTIATKHETKSWHSTRPDARFVRLSPDGKSVAVVHRNEITVDKSDGSAPLVRRGRIGAVADIEFSHNGRWIVTAGDKSQVRVFDATTLRATPLFATHWAPVSAFAFSNHGTWLATGSEVGELFLWNAAKGEIVRRFDGTKTRIRQLAFSQDDRWLAADAAESAVVWDCGTGKRVFDLPQESSRVTAVAFARQQKLILCGRMNGHISCFKTRTWEPVSEFKALDTLVQHIAFSPNGERFAVCGDGKAVRVFDAQTNKRLMGLGGKGAYFLAFSHDGKTLVAESADDQIVAWNLRARSKVRGFKPLKPAGCMACSPTKPILAISYWSKGIRIISMPKQRLLRVMGVRPGPYYALCFSSDGKTLAATAGDGSLRLFPYP